MKKIAIVTDDLVQFGGQERLVLSLCKIWPHAHLYTTVISKEMATEFSRNNTSVITSFLQKLPFITKLNRFYSILLFHILGLESFDFSQYHLVLSVSSRYAHMVVTKPNTIHVCYMNTPGRMFWESTDYFSKEQLFKTKLTKNIFKGLLVLPLTYIRLLDYVASKRVNYFISNSKTPQRRIKKYYKRDSIIIYPPVEVARFLDLPVEISDYFVVLTRLVSWKRVDIAIEACNKLNRRLLIIGTGTDVSRLKKMAGPTVEFLGYVTDSDRNRILSKCRGFIQTQKEDFGISSVEALACGKPVIAYKEGGAVEIIENGVNGIFFQNQDAGSLIDALKKFEDMRFDPEVCRKSAMPFHEKVFHEKVKNYVERLLLE